MKDNGVKLLAAVAVFAMVFAGLAVVMNDVDAVDARSELSKAVSYKYEDYTYNADIVASGDEILAEYSFTEFNIGDGVNEKEPGVMNDFARIMGALYRANVGNDEASMIKTINYNKTEYSWSTEGTLNGSNWTATETLVHDIFNGKSLSELPEQTITMKVTPEEGEPFEMTYRIVVGVSSAVELATALKAGAENIKILKDIEVDISDLNTNEAAIGITSSVNIDGNGKTISATGQAKDSADGKKADPLVMSVDFANTTGGCVVSISNLTIDAKEVAKHAISIDETSGVATTVTLTGVVAKNYYGNGFSVAGGSVTMNSCAAESSVETNWGGVNVEKTDGSTQAKVTVDESTLNGVGVIYSENVATDNTEILPKDYKAPVAMNVVYGKSAEYCVVSTDIDAVSKLNELNVSNKVKIENVELLVNDNVTTNNVINTSGALTITIAENKTLTVDVKGNEIAAEDKTTKLKAIAGDSVTISGGKLVVKTNNTSKVGHENTYAIFATSGISLEDIDLDIEVSLNNGDAFAISGPGKSSKIDFTNVTGTIAGGNRAIQVGNATLTITNSNITLSGGEKAVQQKSGDGSVKVVGSDVTLLLNDNHHNDGTNDRYGMKVYNLNVDAESTIITDGLRLFDISSEKKAEFVNNGIIIVKGGYEQITELDEAGAKPVSGLKSDSIRLNAYDGIAIDMEVGNIYLSDAKYSSTITVTKVDNPAEGEIITDASQAGSTLENTDSVIIKGDVTVDDITLPETMDEDKVITITGTAGGELVLPRDKSVSYNIATISSTPVTVNGLSFSDMSNVVITVSSDKSVMISGKEVSGEIVLDKNGVNVAENTKFVDATFTSDDVSYTSIFVTIPAGSSVVISAGSLKIAGSGENDILILDDDITTKDKIDLEDVTINGGKKITATEFEVTGNVTLGPGVELVVKETMTLGDNAMLTGAGKVTLEKGAKVVCGTGAEISCVIVAKDNILSVGSEADFNETNFMIYNVFSLGSDVTVDGDVTIPAGKTIYLDGNKLTIGSEGSFKVVDSRIDGAGSIVVKGTFTINNSDVLANVDVDDDASVVMEKAKSQTISGQSVDSTAVGYGNTLVLDGVTIESGNTVTAYGNLQIKGTTKIVNGGALVIAQSGKATIQGTMNVAGAVEAYGAVVIDGTVNVSGSKDKSAFFGAYAAPQSEGFSVEVLDEFVTVSKDGVLNIAKPSGATYSNTLFGYLLVKGTLNMNGTFSGYIIDYGTVKINGTVNDFKSSTNENGTIVTKSMNSTVFVMDGVSVNVTSLKGTLAIIDSFSVFDQIDGMAAGTYQYTAGNVVVAQNVKGFTVSTEVTSKVNSTGTMKYFYADMTVSGTVTKTDKNDTVCYFDMLGSISSSDSNKAIGPSGFTPRFGQVNVDETISVGEGVFLVIYSGTVNVNGTLNVIEKDSTAQISAGATVNVNGQIIVGGKNNGADAMTIQGTVNAAVYQTLDPTDLYYTAYYTTVDAAIDNIAGAVDKQIDIIGTATLSSDKTLAEGQTIIVGNGMTLKVGSKATLIMSIGSVLENNGIIDVKGTFVVENYDADFSGAEPKADVLAKEDPKRTYTSLKGAVESGASKIILNRNVTLNYDLTIPEGVLVTTETNGVSITVTNNHTLTVEGGLELPTGTVTLKEAELDTDVSAELIVSGHVLYNNTADNLNKIDGAHYTKKINGRTQNVISSVEYASKDVDDSVTAISIVGKVSSGDVTFTKAKNGLTVTVADKAVFSVTSMRLVGVILDIVGKMTGSVVASTGAQAATTGATVDGVIDLVSAYGIEISSATVETATGKVDFMYMKGTLSGEAKVSAGTVTIKEDLTVTDVNDIDSKFTVADNAVLDVTSKEVTAGNSSNDRANIVIDGTMNLKGNTAKLDVLENGIVDVSGIVDAVEKSEISVIGTMNITGTVTISDEKGKEASFEATGVIALGDRPTDLGKIGSASAIVGALELKDNGYLKAYPGSELKDAKINVEADVSKAVSTAFVINDEMYMTVYTVSSSLTISNVIMNEVFELSGYFNGVNFENANNTGLYKLDNWYTDATMPANKKVDSADKVSKNIPAVYSSADAADVLGTISVGTGLNLYIDGVPVQSGSKVALGVGTHTVRFDTFADYDGSKAVLTFNGQVINNGSTITVGAGDKTFSLAVSGAAPSDSTVVIPSDGADDGMSITDILLIVLVVLIVIMAILVAIRMMRS